MSGSAENPYSAMVGMIRQTAAGAMPKGWGIGTVVSASPLRVNYAGVILIAGQIALPKGTTVTAGDRLAVLPDPAGVVFLAIPID